MLDETLPCSDGFRRDQTKQALTAFVRGIENWHWEDAADGGLCPQFRLKLDAESTQIPINQQEYHYAVSVDRSTEYPIPEQLTNGTADNTRGVQST